MNDRSAFAAVLPLELVRLFDDLRSHFGRISQKSFQSFNRFEQLFVLVLEFFPFQSSKASKLHIQDRLSLDK